MYARSNALTRCFGGASIAPNKMVFDNRCDLHEQIDIRKLVSLSTSAKRFVRSVFNCQSIFLLLFVFIKACFDSSSNMLFRQYT